MMTKIGIIVTLLVVLISCVACTGGDQDGTVAKGTGQTTPVAVTTVQTPLESQKSDTTGSQTKPNTKPVEATGDDDGFGPLIPLT